MLQHKVFKHSLEKLRTKNKKRLDRRSIWKKGIKWNSSCAVGHVSVADKDSQISFNKSEGTWREKTKNTLWFSFHQYIYSIKV